MERDVADQTISRLDYYVYALFRRDNGLPFYIGAGRGGRWSKHEGDAKSGRGRNHHKLRIIRQIIASGDLPKIKIAEGLTRIEALCLEEIFISSIGREPNGPLVNMTSGGDGFPNLSAEAIERRHAKQRGVPKSPEVKEKIRRALKGRKIGSPSDEARTNMRAAQAGHYQAPHSPETRTKMSHARKGQKKSSEWAAKIGLANRGKVRTDATRAALSAAKRGKSLSERHKANISAAFARRRAAET
jgi:NUMOD3 motif